MAATTLVGCPARSEEASAEMPQVAAAPLADPEEPPGLLDRRHLTGEWGGLRTWLEERGLTFEVIYTGEVFANVAGGIDRGAKYLDNTDLQLTADLGALVGWSGATLSLYGLGDQGGDPTELAGDIQVQSNIEAPDGWLLYEAWIQQTIGDDGPSLKVGLWDLNSEFDVSDADLLFLHSSQGTGYDLGQSGRNGPSIFPITSLAARVRYDPWEGIYFLGAVLDGVPGDPEDPGTTAVILSRDDGLLGIVETGWIRQAEAPAGREHEGRAGSRFAGERKRIFLSRLGVGVWGYSAEFEDVLDVDPATGGPAVRRGNWGAYVLGEQVLLRERGDPDQGLSGFLRGGYADPRFNQTGWYAGGGLVYRGPIPGRDRDRLGVAVATAFNGRDFEEARHRDGLPVGQAETALEATYRVELLGWAAVQADVQYVIDPGATDELDDALGIALRFEVVF